LRLVVYPMFYKVLYIQLVVGLGISEPSTVSPYVCWFGVASQQNYSLGSWKTRCFCVVFESFLIDMKSSQIFKVGNNNMRNIDKYNIWVKPWKNSKCFNNLLFHSWSMRHGWILVSVWPGEKNAIRCLWLGQHPVIRLFNHWFPHKKGRLLNPYFLGDLGGVTWPGGGVPPCWRRKRGLDPDVKMQLGESAPWLNAPLRSSAARSQKKVIGLDFTLVTLLVN